MKKKLIILLTLFFSLILIASAYSNTNENINFEQEVEKYFKKLSGTSVDYLMDSVHRASKPIKVASIRQLGEMKAKKATDLLIAVLTYIIDPKMYEQKFAKDKDTVPSFNEEVRAEAAIALGKINDENNFKHIGNTLLADRNSKVKMGCMKGLALTRKKEAIDYIDNAIRYELQLSKKEVNNELVKEGIQSLGEIGHKNAFFILVDITQAENLEYETRREALRTLEKIRWE